MSSTNKKVSNKKESDLSYGPRCPIRTTLELVGGKWKLLILHTLSGGPYRLSELRRLIPDISEKMLIQELKVLADHDMVTRTNHGEVPPRVDYHLTEKGALALPLVGAMKQFADGYLELHH